MSGEELRRTDVSRRAVLRRGSVTALVAATGVSTVGGTTEECDVVVPDDYTTIQEAVDAAASGATVCVRGGTYAEDLTIEDPVTLRGRDAPVSDDATTVDGRISVEPGGEGTTIRRLRIAPSETVAGGVFPDPYGVRITTSDVDVANNVIEGLSADLSDGNGSFTLHGVQVFGANGAVVADVTVRENVIRGFRSEGVSSEWPKYGGIAGVKLQADVARATVRRNRIVDHHSAGWVWGVVLATSASATGIPASVTVAENHIADLNDGAHYDVFDGANAGRANAPFPGSALGVDGDADAGAVTVRRNDLLAPNGAESKDADGTLVAECNWWGAKSGPTHDDAGDGSWALERGDATVEYAPWLVAPSPSQACVDGGGGGGLEN